MDTGSLAIVLMLVVVMCLMGGSLIVDGGRALAAHRHAANTASGAARHAVSSQSLLGSIDNTTIRERVVSYTTRAGVSSTDVEVNVRRDADGLAVIVGITERTSTVFLSLGGASTLTVHATAVARFLYSI